MLDKASEQGRQKRWQVEGVGQDNTGAHHDSGDEQSIGLAAFFYRRLLALTLSIKTRHVQINDK